MPDNTDATVLGQKYAFAAASLMVGLSTFISLLGLEKATLAIVFGFLALRTTPPPTLAARRLLAQVGVGLGVLMWITVPTMLIVFRDRVGALLEALERLP